MTPIINLGFVDDWELRGNGSGNIEQLQFHPMRELVEIYNRHGIKGSFNAEMMQQLTFRKYQAEFPELKKMADDWDEIVQETFRQGHDVQVHVHPQWQGAKYENGQWQLPADWSILNCAPAAAIEMLRESTKYLENLLRPINPEYRCVSFRSGAWCMAPSPFMLDVLVQSGFVFDISIDGGVLFKTRNIQLDYTNCEETFMPYYPAMHDARRVSSERQDIICVPTHHFYSSRRSPLSYHIGKVSRKIGERVGRSNAQKNGRPTQKDYAKWTEAGLQSLPVRVFKEVLKPYWAGKHFISDLSKLYYALMREMLADIRLSARRSGLSEVAIVLECHTKDIYDFSHIERFLRDVAQANDVRCVTLTDIAKGFESGRFDVRLSDR